MEPETRVDDDRRPLYNLIELGFLERGAQLGFAGGFEEGGPSFRRWCLDTILLYRKAGNATFRRGIQESVCSARLDRRSQESLRPKPKRTVS
jgi:hypothetical protein